jgi:ApbE superfamily uncharacterized protein (UPF0280 family)
MSTEPVLTYRNGLFYLRTTYREADLLIASENISTVNKSLARFIEEREAVQNYVEKHPEFLYSLEPVKQGEEAPPAVSAAVEASTKAGVGPMASLPGALADTVLDAMLNTGATIAIVENGGEISMKMNREAIVGVYTGRELNLGLILDCSQGRIGISTSSSSVSHALSFGEADAAVVVAENAALADAVSTRVGNMIKSGCGESLEEAVKLALSIKGVKGCIMYSGELLSFGGSVKPIVLKASRREMLENVMLKGSMYNFFFPPLCD